MGFLWGRRVVAPPERIERERARQTASPLDAFREPQIATWADDRGRNRRPAGHQGQSFDRTVDRERRAQIGKHGFLLGLDRDGDQRQTQIVGLLYPDDFGAVARPRMNEPLFLRQLALVPAVGVELLQPDSLGCGPVRRDDWHVHDAVPFVLPSAVISDHASPPSAR